MRLVKLVFISVPVFIAAWGIYTMAPDFIRYGIGDWFARLGAPTFIESVDLLESRDQTEVIREYKNRGYTLTCYGNLQREEKIGKDNDFLCNTYVSAIYDNIPARLITFFFVEQKLSHIRFELPDSSFEQLQDYLARKLDPYERVDEFSRYDFGTDNFGQPLMVWAVSKGLVTTSARATKDQKLVMLWSRMPQGFSTIYY